MRWQNGKLANVVPPVQDARKGVLFDSFPPVLQLQLKRFEYDFQRDMMVKVGCRAMPNTAGNPES